MREMTGQALAGRTAMVCGASRGIGRACAQEFARQGARVILVSRRQEALEKVRESLDGKEHRILAADFDDPPALEASTKEFLLQAGPVHVLLNNAGGPPSGTVLDARPEAFLAAFRQHLISFHLLAQVVIPVMRESKYGRIVNIVSTSVRQPIRGLGVSNTVRSAVAGWAKTLSTEVAPFGITVNNILPGATLTDRLSEIVRERARRSGRDDKVVEAEMIAEIPAGRFGTPEEIAAAAAFLAGPFAGYITGVSLPVDGGRTLSI
jgi:3-oxoacyl-[acyl-carrier protein] reductase